MYGAAELDKRWVVWKYLNYVPNELQLEMHVNGVRNQVSSAGRRTGKSTGNGRELTYEAQHLWQSPAIRTMLEDAGVRAEYWITGPNYTDPEKEFRVFYNDCRKIGIPFDKPGTYYSLESGNMVVSLFGGQFIVRCQSAAHPENLVGEGLFGIVLSEAAKMKESVWLKYLRPTLADFTGWTKMGSTPEGKNWFYRAWQDGQDPSRPDWWSVRAPSWYNRTVFPLGRHDPEIEAMRVDLGEEMFNQEVAALFSEFVGRVFGDWDEEVHVTDIPYDPRLPVFIATDYGWTNPNVALFIQTNVWDDVFVIAEYYRVHRTDEEFAEDVLVDPKLGPLSRVAKKLYPDPEDPKASNALARKWKCTLGGGTGGLRINRIKAIRQGLKTRNEHLVWGHPERKPKLFVDRRCTETIREMDAWRYPENKSELRNAKEEPLDKDNHAPEALGRFYAGHFGLGAGGQRPRVRQAQVSR